MNPKSAGVGNQPVLQAIDAFVGGFTFTRSFTHPYISERIGHITVMRDAPRRHGRYRREEWVAFDVTPGQVHETVKQHTRGHYVVCAVCAMDGSDAELREGYRALGYRLQGSEALMIHPLNRIPRPYPAASVSRVTTTETAARLAVLTRTRPLQPEFFKPDAPLRQYIAVLGSEITGWVRSVSTGNSSWCADMFVKPEFRRLGIGRSLLCRMLRDDRAHGADSAVLLASRAGAMLYPTVGFKQVGTLYAFNPLKHG